MSIFLVAAKRTPFGAFGGSLKGLSATDLGVISTQAALANGNVDPSLVDSVFFGNVIQSSSDAAYLARHVGLRSGVSEGTPCLTINRLCGSGFETVILGAQSIMLGESQISICGGAENMSDAPLQASGNDSRWGIRLGKGLSMRDSLWDGLTDSYGKEFFLYILCARPLLVLCVFRCFRKTNNLIAVDLYFPTEKKKRKQKKNSWNSYGNYCREFGTKIQHYKKGMCIANSPTNRVTNRVMLLERFMEKKNDCRFIWLFFVEQRGIFTLTRFISHFYPVPCTAFFFC